MGNYYTYERAQYTCFKCGWEGLGADTDFEDHWDYGFTIACPKCHEKLPDFIDFPTFNQTMAYGSEEDKEMALERAQFLEEVEAAELKDVDQLPELEGTALTFTLKEKETEGAGRAKIEIWLGPTLVWEELRTYEYYDRFIQLGDLFKKKYGRRMVDFDPAAASIYLGGDSITAYDKIRAARARWQVN